MSIRVLHVDEDEPFAELSATAIERADERLDVTVETSAETALARISGEGYRGDPDAEPFECVVSDYEMPGMDGVALLNAVRESRPRLPFVLFTGRGGEVVARDALREGATDYLRKGEMRAEDQFATLANRIVRAVERRRVAVQADRQREWFRTVLDGAWASITVVDDDDRIAYQTPSTERLFGHGSEALLGADLFSFVHPEDRERVRDRLTEFSAADPDRVEGVEYRFQHADGSWRWVLSRAVDRSGTVVDGVVITTRDVTGQRERDGRLRAERDSLETLLEDHPDPVATCRLDDGQFVVRAVNRAFTETFGRSPDAAADDPLSALVGPSAVPGGDGETVATVDTPGGSQTFLVRVVENGATGRYVLYTPRAD